jgi:O-antigen ligase
MNNWNIASNNGISSSLSGTFFLLFILAQLGFLLLFVLTGSPYPVLMVFFGCFLLYKIAFSVQHTVFLLSFYLIVFPDYGWGKNYPFFKFFVSYQVVTAFIFIAVLFWLARNALKDSHTINISAQDIAISVFLFSVLLSAFIGFLNGHQTKYIYKEFYFLSLYGVYFVVVKGITNPNWVRQFWKLLVIATFVASWQYLFLTLSEVNIGELLIGRVTTQQPHLAQLAIPYLASFFLFRSSFGKRIISFLVLVPILIMVFLSQQRSLWVGVPISIAILWIFSLLQKQISLRRIIRGIIGAIIFVLFVVGTLLLLDKLFAGSTVVTLAARLDTLLRIAEDKSALDRMAEISIALGQWKQNVLFGTGLGSTIHRVATHMRYDILDNSYAFILWKAGLLGFFAYMAMIILFYQRGLTMFRKVADVHNQRIIASTLSGFAGLMLIALTNNSLMLYRFVIVWAVLFASLEFLYGKLKRGDQIDPDTVEG